MLRLIILRMVGDEPVRPAPILRRRWTVRTSAPAAVTTSGHAKAATPQRRHDRGVRGANAGPLAERSLARMAINKVRARVRHLCTIAPGRRNDRRPALRTTAGSEGARYFG